MSDSAIRTLIFPLKAGNILLPGAVVAEIIQFREPDFPLADSHEWILGALDWRSHKVPILDYDQLNGLPPIPPPEPPNPRLVILYGLKLAEAVPFYSFVCQNMPATVMISADQLDQFSADKQPGLLGSAKLGEDTVWLPDMDYLENLLAQSGIVDND